MSRSYGKGTPEATIHPGAARMDVSQEYVIKRSGGHTQTVVTTSKSARVIRDIMSERSGLMRRLADR
jgi:hypothetical protein